MSITDKPLAAPGLTSYRYAGRYGWIMIGARSTEDALREARRSSSGDPAEITAAGLQVWAGDRYVNVQAQQ